jgi:hypothetical protein
MMALREIMIWIVQAVLFGIGIGVAELTAQPYRGIASAR